MTQVWLIRNDTLSQELEEGGFISIGWDGTGDLNRISLEVDSLIADLRKLYPDSSVGSLRTWAHTLRRFRYDVAEGDIVVVPYVDSARLRIGYVTGTYYYVPDAPAHRHRIPVEWTVTNFPKCAVTDNFPNGLRSISTISRIHRVPDLFQELAHNPAKVRELRQAAHEDAKQHRARNIWLVGSRISNEDKTAEFVKGGYWALSDGVSGRAQEMVPGDRIAIKATTTKKRDLPFENHGLPVSTMIIKARGTVQAIESDRVLVDWDHAFQERVWYFFTHRHAIWRLNPDHHWAPHLERFIFDGEDQDYEAFLNSEFWRRYRDEGAKRALEEKVRPASYRKANPTADPVYDAAQAWKTAVIQGQSLFSGEPLDYKEATAGFIEYFVNRPDAGEGTFLGKLQTQLAPAPTSTVQLAAELMFIYTLPLQPGSMKQATKISHVNTILGWRDDSSPMPDALETSLRAGIIRVGTAFHTFRWAIFQYLVHLMHELASLSLDERAHALNNWAAFQELLDGIHVQGAQSMRLILEHLFFPDRALLNASTADRQRMSIAFSEFLGKDGDVNELIQFLEPNIQYGDRYEVNVYAAPYRSQWLGIGDGLTTWSAWASLILEESELLTDEEPATQAQELTPDNLPGITAPLQELQSDASKTLLDWLQADQSRSLKALAELGDTETSAAIDYLHRHTGFDGPSSEFLEAATGLFSQIDETVPKYYRASVRPLLMELCSLTISPEASPGELFMSLREAMESLRSGLFYRDGIELNVPVLAALAQQVISLDLGATDWDQATRAAFADWRAGLPSVSPDELATEPQPLNDTEPTPPREARTKTIPATLDALAQRLTFVTDESNEWLRVTQSLLWQKRQIIFQGPPGTGKTFLARQLAEFLTQDPERVTLVQFHPATTYEDFVQGLRPETGTSGAFALRNGPLLEAAKRAEQEPHATHVMIIDEIIRANLPAVFGELYFLLEYRNEEVTLNYGDTFKLPENLLLIGTMNTADRSIAAIDSALRRRFFIRDLRPEEVPMNDVLDQHLEQFAPDLKWMVKLLDRANELIGDPDQSIGPSHFLLGDNLTEETARQAWKFTVMPTLREHFYGQSGRLDELTFDQLRAYALTGGVDAAAD